MSTFFRGLFTALWTAGFAVLLTALTSGIWSALLLTNLTLTPTLPWAAGVMAGIVVATYTFLGGRWGGERTRPARRALLRATPVPPALFATLLIAGILSLVALSGLWIVLFELVKAPGNSVGDFSHYPRATLFVSLAMAATSGAVSEEAGFRGYFQGSLERFVPAPIAIFVCALVMAPEHASTQGFVWTTMLFYLLSDVMLGTCAAIARSIVPGIVVHAIGLFVFFSLIWPHDAERSLIWQHGPDAWFWLHVAQAFIFGAIAIVIFARAGRLARSNQSLPSPSAMAQPA